MNSALQSGVRDPEKETMNKIRITSVSADDHERASLTDSIFTNHTNSISEGLNNVGEFLPPEVVSRFTRVKKQG